MDFEEERYFVQQRRSLLAIRLTLLRRARRPSYMHISDFRGYFGGVVGLGDRPLVAALLRKCSSGGLRLPTAAHTTLERFGAVLELLRNQPPHWPIWRVTRGVEVYDGRLAR